MIKMAMVGCGAVAQDYHLPAALHTPEVKVTHVIDTNPILANKARSLAGAEFVLTDYRDAKSIDAVIVAVPHFLHAQIVSHFLRCGVHVFCEKPLALKLSEARELVETAKGNNLVLAVGVFRRYYPTSRFLRQAIRSEWLGDIIEIDAEEGAVYDWNLQSTFMMKREQAGGGVLVDSGSHTLDRILSCFTDINWRLRSYRDNAYGAGVESDCELKFDIDTIKYTLPVRIELSRTRHLRNTVRIIMKNGSIEALVNDPYYAWFVDHRLGENNPENRPIRVNLADSENHASLSDKLPFFIDQLQDFVKAIQEKCSPINNAESVLNMVDLIDRAYEKRTLMDEPWVHFRTDSILDR
jgi:predicted dehydrogenase